MIKKIMIFLFAFTLFTGANAQSLDDVFDDGGLSNINNNVSIRVSDLVEGFVSIGVEHYFKNQSSIGGGFGFLVFDGMDMHYLLTFDREIPNFHVGEMTKGYLFHVFYRAYIADHDRLFTQYSFSFKKRQGNLSKEQTFAIPEWRIGYKFKLTNRLSLLAATGFGLGFEKVSSKPGNTYLDGRPINYESEIFNFGFYIPFSIDIAFDF